MALSRRSWLEKSLIVTTNGFLLSVPGLLRAEESSLACALRSLPVEAVGTSAAAIANALRFHPSGRILATGGDDHTVQIWDLAEEKRLHTLAGHTNSVRAIAFSVSGEQLASCGNDGRVFVWDSQQWKRRALGSSFAQACAAIDWHPHEKYLAVALFSGELIVLESATGKVVHCFKGPSSDLCVVAFSPDGQLLATAGRSGQVRVWQWEEQKLLTDIPAHTQRVRAMLLSSDNAGLVTVGEDGIIRVTSLSAGYPSYELPRQACRIFSATFCGENLLATAGSDQTIRLWNLRTRESLGLLGTHAGSVASLDAWGDTLVSGGFDSELKLWLLNTSSAKQALPRVSARGVFRLQ